LFHVDQYHIEVLSFADDLNILEDSLEDIMRAIETLEHTVWQIKLQINPDKTKLMKLGARIAKTEKAFFALLKFLKSKIFSMWS